MTDGLLPEGVRDRLAPQADAAAALLRAVIDVISAHGYLRVQPPLAEFEEELVGRLNGTGQRDLFRLVDPVSARTLALRPDMTAQISRISTTRLVSAARPLRLGYGGQVLKLRATQLRPERELCQAGAELIGSDTAQAAIEVILVALEALAAAGVRNITLDLTLPDLVETLAAGPLPLPHNKIAAVRAALDAKDAGRLVALGAQAYLPLIAAAGPCAEALAYLRAIDATQVLAPRLAALAQIADAVGDKARVTLDPAEHQGFEYQTWLGFSLFGTGLIGEAGRGGSYGVIHADGHVEPAIGFSLYLDPLVDAGLGQTAAMRVFLPLSTDAKIAKRLRAAGWVTVAALGVDDDAGALGCSHRLQNGQPVLL